MKRIRLSYIRILALILATSTVACKENLQEQEFTPEEKETEMINVSDELYQFTLQFDEDKSDELDAAIEKVRKNEFVQEVVKESDHIKVVYKNGLEIYYPIIMPSAFEGSGDDAIEAKANSLLKTRVDPYGGYYRGKCKIFNFFSDDPDRTGQTKLLEKVARIARSFLRLVPESGPKGDYEEMLYGKEKVTIANIEEAIKDPANEVVVIASHGFQNTVVTSEYVLVKDLSGLSSKDLANHMAQERLIACGEKDAKGNPVYNKAWYVKNYSGRWNADFVYFTGCGIFTPSVCDALNNNSFAYSLIAGWDGKNNMGEAILLAMFDCFYDGMSFKDFYSKVNSHSSYGANLVYAGNGSDYKPSDKTLALDERVSRIKYPKDFCEREYLKAVTVQMILEDNLDKAGSFQCEVYDVLEGTNIKSSTFFNESLFNLFDQIFTASDWSVTYWLSDPGVYKVSLNYYFTRQGVTNKVLIDQKYLLKCNGYGVNGVEDTVPTIKLATVVTDAANLLYGCQVAVCPDDLIEQGFKVWERDNPSEMMEIQGTPHQDNSQVFQASLNGLKAGTKYQAKAFVKYITGDEFTGNVVEFTASSGSSTDPSVPIPEAVDLGLSVKWASFNLGASKPEEYGDFYAWGETECKDYYWWDTYKWGDMNSLTKYNSNGSQGVVDNKKDLSEYAFEDDAARVKLGAPWRIPTVNECSELINECEWVWSSRNGIHGYEVTGPNGNVIFLSAAGNWYYGGYTLSGYCGDYWTSSIASPETGNELFFNSQGQYIMGT